MVTDSNELLGQALGTCTLQRLLGRGGMGAVYLAQQSRPRRIVAVKVLLPGIVEQRPRSEFLIRFRREADAVAALDHVNIMPVYEYGEQGETAYLVMPYVTGGTLRDILEKRGTLTQEEVVPIAEQVAAGLDAAHAQGIVHRDLKPGNILFHADGRVMIADFGLAKVVKDVTDQESTNGHLTSIGTIVGTPEYLSPEQSTGDAIDYRTDVYSFGIVLYQMLAGRVPFTGTSPVAVAIKHTIEEPPPLTRFNPSIPTNVEAVVMKAIKKKPEERYASAGEFALTLRYAVTEALGGNILHAKETPFKYTPLVHATPALFANKTPSPEKLPAQLPKTGEEPTKLVSDQHAGQKHEPSMSTMLMSSDTKNQHGTLTKAAPKLPLQEGRLQAQPKVNTNDETVADRPFARPTVANKTASRQQNVSPVKEQPAERFQQALPPPQVQVLANQHPLRLLQSTGRPLWMAVVGCILVFLIVGGGVAAYLHGQSNQDTNREAGKVTTPTPSHTPQSQATQPGLPPVTLPDVPGGVITDARLSSGISIGSRLYGTPMPGAGCDKQGGQWAKSDSVTVTCGQNMVTVANTGSKIAGTFLNQIPGQQIPSNYIMQVEASVNSASYGRFGIFFRNQPNSPQIESDSFLIDPAGTWSALNYDGSTGTTSAMVANHSLQTRIQGNITIDVVVQGNTFIFYVNGTKEGYASNEGGTTGTVGLAVEPGANITFKNLSVFAV